jgi:hypothetical protein
LQLLTLVPSEVPLLELGLLNLEVFGHRRGLAIFGDGKCELLVQRQANGLASVGRLVNLEADVEVLASKEVGPVISCLV